MSSSEEVTTARIRHITRDEATPEQRRVGDAIFGSRNEEYGGPSAVLLRIPDLAERLEHLREYLVHERRLPEQFLHLAALITARFWSSHYTWWKRVDMCLAAGIPPEVIDAVRERRRPTFEDDGLEAIYDYVMELLETRRIGDGTHDRVRAILGEDVLLELVMVVGFYSMLALLSDASEPDLPPGATGLLDD